MALSILNNIPSLAAQNQLSITGSSLQKTLFRLSSGSRINSGADDAAGLAIADGLRANVSALTQSARNATDGIGKLQVADGALSQVSTLLNRAVTLATEASTGTINTAQAGSLNSEYQAIKDEIDRIGLKTTFNNQTIFQGAATVNDTNTWSGGAALTSASTLTAGTLTITDTKTGFSKTYTGAVDANNVGDLITAITADKGTSTNKLDVNAAIVGGKLQITDASSDHSLYITAAGLTGSGGAIAMAANTASVGNADVFLGDGGTITSANTISTTINALSAVAGLALTSDLTSVGNAQTALTQITAAVQTVANQRGTIGASINRLQSASNVMQNQVQNLSAAEDGIRAADIAQEVANMTKFNILNQTGISALAQANQMQQGVLSLLR